MTKWTRVIPAAALALTIAAPPALAQSQQHHEEVEFASDHPCTREFVEGDTKVKMTITTTDNGDGTTTVHVHQHTHGQQLLGVVSGDWYVFNENQDSHTTETIIGPSGSVDTHTRFIHTTEDLAYQELAQGLDDFHQRLEVVIQSRRPLDQRPADVRPRHGRLQVSPRIYGPSIAGVE
jgi:hypothetical protein